MKRNELNFGLLHRLDLNARGGVDMVMLSRIAQERQSLHGAVTAARRVIDMGRPWLRFLGWWREAIVTLEHQTNWTSTPRGCAASADLRRRQWSIGAERSGRFLRWCEQKIMTSQSLTVQDIDGNASSLKVWGDGVVCQWLTRHRP